MKLCLSINKNSLSAFSIFFIFFLLKSGHCLAQTGLEGIIIEKYYIAGPGDTLCPDSIGCIPPGSITYRIYADLAPVYRLQAIYGVQNHELQISTSTRFYNCPTADGITANDIHPTLLTTGFAMLDSWLSVGAAALDYQAVLKSEDDTMPSLALMNKQGLLQNRNPDAGIPLIERDGMRFLKLQPAVSFFNMEQDLRIFDYQYASEVSGLIRTTDGAWASYGGAVGPQPENRVLVAQLTTDGVLTFELNLQLAVPGGGVEKYVARNGIDGERENPCLRYNSSEGKIPPQIELHIQEKKSLMKEQTQYYVDAEVYDNDGSVSSVEFYMNGKRVTQLNAPPFIFEFHNPEPGAWVYAVAIDNEGLKRASSNMRFSKKQ